ncbi:putative HAD family hydrolase [Paratrimastix pyriformis]|uniref:HAD family hydrolase n=1 Tax=Paratrimastix pyriformis TaxID=342808 RepID=A0ABQ8UKC8_9EUKA|nr:putative HAD family hydrolase [Paratrimastix pyriformis]|eukprot:GAFH01005358.1.p1 GENE.GAFH01005358.1~~GAFH01005358.1.p1  ORF type:complete len:164 (-),score=1.92 GAFH01005358.1:63-554(-)
MSLVLTRHLVFDWGDTLMADDPTRTDAMYLWPTVHLIPGADTALAALSQKHVISLATGASVSDESMVRRALARVNIDQYFRHVISSKDVGARKAEPAFWQKVLERIGARPEEVTVIGDGFESDVVRPTSLGMHAIWLNRRTAEDRTGERYVTIHALEELIVQE